MTTDYSPEIAALEAEATAALKGASDLAALEEAERTFFRSKKSRYAEMYQQLGSMAPEARREVGRMLNELRGRLEILADSRRSELVAASRAERLAADHLDLTEVLPGRLAGHLHLVTQVREALEDVFIGMGYEIAEGPEVETGWRNFEALNIPEDHPARSPLDTFYVEFAQPGSVVLRPHTSPVQIRLLERGVLPIYAVAPGRTYRKDTPDSTHLPVFHQIEGLVVDRGVTFADLKGTIDTFVRAIFGEDTRNASSSRLLPFHRAFGRIRDVVCDLWGRGLSDLRRRRLDRARRMRDGAPGRVRGDRCRPRGMDRVRLRVRDRPDRHHASRHRRSAGDDRKRREVFEPVLTRAPGPRTGAGRSGCFLGPCPQSWLRSRCGEAFLRRRSDPAQAKIGRQPKVMPTGHDRDEV